MEDSRLRDASLGRLAPVLAAATMLLVSETIKVVRRGTHMSSTLTGRGSRRCATLESASKL
ncbi:hypothetical protein GCM10008949_25670 [Deinococcus humi]|nr:hypothetical protein GCM10008949_25670 [Deinococcus humi]